ncbi:carbohydrate kinase [uncultured Duncaniella sp.]|uniref:carbohydrate kinase family protein n=3 Tax=uncultured Duncaniella sp. TaxID=2768039 RepID=UPI0025ED699D|nr:carbohydrate kinase [uncultured Duncaniella sp.]
MKSENCNNTSLPAAGKVVGLGELLWDVLPEGKKLGGAPANFAYHISQFGLNGVAVSAIGDDELGREIVSVLEGKDVNSLLSIVDFPTGTVQVTLDGDGIPSYEIKTDVAWDNIPFTPEMQKLASETVAVCFGSLAQRDAVSRATINAFLDSMPEGEGIYKVFDINLRQNFYTREIIEASMERCNVLKINDEEIITVGRLFNLDRLSMEEIAEELLGRYRLDILILTCGAHGSYVFTPGNVSFVETPVVEVADTVGAGDSFTATFVASLLNGLPIVEAHRLAVNVSAYVCTCHGATPTLPSHLIDRSRK